VALIGGFEAGLVGLVPVLPCTVIIMLSSINVRTLQPTTAMLCLHAMPPCHAFSQCLQFHTVSSVTYQDLPLSSFSVEILPITFVIHNF